MPRTGARLARFNAAVEQAGRFYFTCAERLNGRMAMLGFTIATATEAFTGHTLVSHVIARIVGIPD